MFYGISRTGDILSRNVSATETSIESRLFRRVESVLLWTCFSVVNGQTDSQVSELVEVNRSQKDY
jgi:hypothetical protein